MDYHGSSTHMPTDLMRYDLMTQDAMRNVVRKALERVAHDGLPGEHHFFITFLTQAPGVDISDVLVGRYPHEMTIVLQHQFWGLEVTETGFTVGLTFNKIPEKLVIPFSAIKGFFDPSVQFGLQFPVEGETYDVAGEEDRAEDWNEEAMIADAADDAAEDGEAEVVSLDMFRKK